MLTGTRNTFANIKLAALLSVAPATFLVTATAACAQAQVQIDIPAQGRAAAIRELAIQTRAEVIFDARDVGNARVPALKGNFTPQEALTRLLRGTALSVRKTSQGAYLISSAQNVSVNGSPDALGESAPAEATGISEILVKGTRSANVDIRRTENDAQPYVVFDREQIQKAGVRSLDDFLRTRVSQNAQLTPADQSVLGLPTGGAISLRGLGLDQTLLLIDGRRVTSVGTNLGQGNIRGIPLGAIERIEVLPSTAGAIYGGSAIGGVINVVLRRDYTGFEVNAEYGNTFDWATGDFRVEVNGGFHLGSTSISLTASHSQKGDLLLRDRNDLLLASRRLTLANSPDSLFGSTPILSRTPNICSSTSTGSGSCNGVPLVLDDGTPLGSAYTYVPEGYAGPVATGDGGAALLANAGSYNLDAALDEQALSQANETQALALNIRHPVASWLDLFADAYYDHSRLNIANPVAEYLLLQADDPNNPFQQPIRMSISVPDISRRYISTIDNIRLTGGAIFRLPNRWSASLEVARTSGQVTSKTDRFFLAAADRPVAAQFGVQDVMTTMPDFASLYPENEVMQIGPYRNRALNLSARVAGPLVDLPAGPLTISALAERRMQRIRGAYAQSTPTLFSYYAPQKQNINSVYAEARVPIFSEKNATPGIHGLDFQASVRRDHYLSQSTSQTLSVTSREDPLPPLDYLTNRFSSTDYLIAGRYQPVEGVTFRGSYSTGFLPPGLNSFRPRIREVSAATTVFTDPKRGGQGPIGDSNGLITQVQGGNPNIGPEKSKSWSVGVIIQPTSVPGFRVALDYTVIRKTDDIQQLQLQQLIDLEDSFPDRITRGPRLPGDPAGWAGPIIGYDQSVLNVAEAQVRALDFRFDMDIGTSGVGTFHPYAYVTHAFENSNALLPGDPLEDTVGFRNGMLAWQGNFGFDWDLGNLGAGWNTQFYGSYRICYTFDSDASCGNREATQGNASIPSQFYHDLYVRYSFAEAAGLTSGLELSLGIQNVLDKKPPVVALGTSTSVLASSRHADLLGRRFTLSLRKAF